jgi:outer membrane receptor protein involved in Fe transport
MHRPESRHRVAPARAVRRLIALLAAALLCSLVAPPLAIAQDAGPEDVDDEDAALEEAAAAGSVAPPSDVEVIRIKGRAVTAIETDVPESATQFDAAAIEAMGAQNISDLAKVTPNVEIVTSGSTSPTFFIRGVGLSDFNANAAGAVGIYQDDVAINAPAIQLGQLFDVENVEVLRGPQGGGSGRNASAGAIKVYSRKPTGDTTAEFQTSYGRFNSQDYQGALEVPIIDEILSTRFAFRFVKRDGYLENGCANGPSSPPVLGPGGLPAPDRLPDAWPGPPADKNDFRNKQYCGERTGVPTNRGPVDNPFYLDESVYPFDASLPRRDQQNQRVGWSAIPADLPNRLNNTHNWSVRGQFRLQPPDTDMDWLLNGHGGRRDELSYLGQAMGTGGGFLGQTTLEGYQELDQKAMFDDLLASGLSVDDAREQLSVELARNLDKDRFRGDYNRVGDTTLDQWGTFLRGEGGIGDARWRSISAYDGYKRFRDTDSDFTPDVLFESVNEDEAWQFTQELQFDGELEDTPLRWEIGGYYLMQKLKFDGQTFLRFDLSNGREYEEDLYSFAFFGGFAWDFLDDFTLEGGVRYNWEQKNFAYTLTQGSLVNPTEFDTQVWDAPTGTISLTYRPVEDVSIYWKYSRGWKGGQYNASAVSVQREDPDASIISAAQPEDVDAWEVGLRGRFLDGRLGIGGSLFYYKYQNYQVFVVVDAANAPPNIEVVNANDAEVYGAELDVRAEPFDGFVVTGRVGWLESQFLDFSNTVFRNLAPPGGSTPRPTPITADFSGNTLINSPKIKASLAVEWTIDMGRWGSLIPRYDFSWTDDIFFDATEGRGALDDKGNQPLPDYAVGQRAYWLHNARLAYRTPEGNIEIAAFARNFMNQGFKTYAFDASSFTDVVINYVGEPRMIGGSLSITW